MSPMASTTRPRVLVVDDEENIRYLVGSALRLDGFETITAETGAAALEAASAYHLDVIVLDIMLPDLDGFTVLQRLRDRGCQAPVVFLTARDSTEDRVRGLTTGGADYMVKPFAVASSSRGSDCVSTSTRRTDRAPNCAAPISRSIRRHIESPVTATSFTSR